MFEIQYIKTSPSPSEVWLRAYIAAVDQGRGCNGASEDADRAVVLFERWEAQYNGRTK